MLFLQLLEELALRSSASQVHCASMYALLPLDSPVIVPAKVYKIYSSLCPGKPLPKPRFATLRTLYELNADSFAIVLDSDALVLYFPAPRTVTGEDVLELHIHGGPATIKAVLAAIPRCVSNSAIRYAEPGEFTRLAFQNNRLDLAQVEALSDTLSAETEQQRRAAVRGNSGALGRTYEKWRQQLLEARGELEAIIDFSEDQCFDSSNAELLGNISRQVKSMLASIEVHEEASRRGELLRKGIRISMLGHPNAGKSSLLNLIIGREASIVSAEAGTTRDVVEVGLDIEGYLCTFADTAGLRSALLEQNGSEIQQIEESVGKVELEGIRRAKAKAGESDIVLVLASVEPLPTGQGWQIQFDLEALQIASRVQDFFIIVSKVDLVPERLLYQLLDEFKLNLARQYITYRPENLITVSCINAQENKSSAQPGRDVKQLINRLVTCFKNLTSFEDEHLLGVTERQRQLLKACREHCEEYIEEAENSSKTAVIAEGEFDIVLAAEHLRSAGNCLSRITGRGDAGDVEEVLGVVFEK
jgi:tRNA modification GTPase